jgi:hypothetical protein
MTWYGSNEIGALYVIGQDELHRIGNCPNKNLVSPGDVALCTGHSGDGFNDYVLVDVQPDSVRARYGTNFGAYDLRNCLMELSDKERKDILKGKTIKTKKPWKELK